MSERAGKSNEVRTPIGQLGGNNRTQNQTDRQNKKDQRMQYEEQE